MSTIRIMGYAKTMAIVVGYSMLALVAGYKLGTEEHFWTGAGLYGRTSERALEYLAPRLPDGRQRAFPTAEGYGAASKGGRGGTVIYVTTTADHGPGSLRACIDAAGPRVCLFRVSGTITLDTTSLVIRNPYITIAGETAPGGGIAIRNAPMQPRPSLEILAHDVIIRHLRLRPGPHTVESCCSGALGLYGRDARNIIIDHFSASWGSDETIDSEDATYFTLQWGIISEPLLNGGPGKHNRARNMLLTNGGFISVHHNLFALGKFRNPLLQMSGSKAIGSVVNNVMYSPIWDYVVSFSDRWTAVRANVVANYKIAGKSEKNDRLLHLFEEGGKGFSIFLSDNIDETYRPDLETPEEEVIAPEMRRFLAKKPFDDAGIRTSSAMQAYEDVLSGAGATKPARDKVDLRIVDAVRRRKGELLKTSPETVGGWPILETVSPPADMDMDGMPDEWERSVGLQPDDPADGPQDSDGDGWTNLEEYLHEMAGDGQGMERIPAAKSASS